jgi:hypothetical protein
MLPCAPRLYITAEMILCVYSLQKMLHKTWWLNEYVSIVFVVCSLYIEVFWEKRSTSITLLLRATARCNIILRYNNTLHMATVVVAYLYFFRPWDHWFSSDGAYPNPNPNPYMSIADWSTSNLGLSDMPRGKTWYVASPDLFTWQNIDFLGRKFWQQICILVHILVLYEVLLWKRTRVIRSRSNRGLMKHLPIVEHFLHNLYLPVQQYSSTGRSTSRLSPISPNFETFLVEVHTSFSFSFFSWSYF